MRISKFLRISILSLYLIFLLTPIALAQVTGIKVSPLRVEKLVDPGEVLEEGIKVTNVSNSPATFYVYLMDFKARGEGGQALLIPAGSGEVQSLTPWIEIVSGEMDFAPGEKKKIPFTIRVPREADPGGHYGAIVLGTVPPEIDTEGVAIAVGQQAGVLLLLRVSGDVIEDAKVREFSTDKNFYGVPFKVNFVTRVENLGNTHIKPHGIIEITNMLGRRITTLRVNDAGANVLPNSIRRFENSWEGDFGFGKYTASLALSFGTFAYEGGQGRQTLYVQRSFWILPWRIIIPIFLGLIFIGALFALFLRIYKNKAIEKALREAGLRRVRYVRKYEGPSPTLYFSLILVIILIITLLIGGVIFFLFFV